MFKSAPFQLSIGRFGAYLFSFRFGFKTWTNTISILRVRFNLYSKIQTDIMTDTKVAFQSSLFLFWLSHTLLYRLSLFKLSLTP